MSKLKATQSGKAGKHKGQDTFATVFVRGLRKARVTTLTDLQLLQFISSDSGDDQESALAGKARRPKHKLKIVGEVVRDEDKPAKAPIATAAG